MDIEGYGTEGGGTVDYLLSMWPDGHVLVKPQYLYAYLAEGPSGQLESQCKYYLVVTVSATPLCTETIIN